MHPGLAFAAAIALHLVPHPQQVERLACPPGGSAVPLTVAPEFDPAALTELNQRWQALGAGRVATASVAQAAIVARRDASLPAQAYRLTVRDGRAWIASAGPEGAFYAAMTLAQLAERIGPKWAMPCVRIEDRPALRWRILSDDVSRGPLPTMSYFKQRIRTIAAFKMNGYSPYMEHVFVSPTDPLPAPLDGITPAQLHDLADYARRFHVALICEQQSFAHMHNTLRLERYADAAELPHGFLLSPASALPMQYLSRIVAQELAAVGRTPFFHIGADETATLGIGQSRAVVGERGRSAVYAQHIVAMNRLIAPSGARLMLWDDGIENDPGILRRIPKDAVVVNWHYQVQASYEPYIQTIAGGGFEQMVAPGASNWNEIFPAIDTALVNERRFINEGKAARALGAFEAVWHDDGETLYEATWYPVIYAATLSWGAGDVSPENFDADYPSAFYGVDDPGYAANVRTLGSMLDALEAPGVLEQTNALFWRDPFDTASAPMPSVAVLRRVRLAAESLEQERYFVRPPLHPNAAFVTFLAARRYDLLARKFQVAAETRAMYADAVAHAQTDPATVFRDLLWCRYWMWELRDAYEDLEPLYARAWRYESRDGHLASNLERYQLAAQQAIERADAFARVTRQYAQMKSLPPFDTVVGL